jgi:hypothetical protein
LQDDASMFNGGPTGEPATPVVAVLPYGSSPRSHPGGPIIGRRWLPGIAWLTAPAAMRTRPCLRRGLRPRRQPDRHVDYDAERL